jgi:N-acetylglucosamine kinase-like BadF-type ATPase
MRYFLGADVGATKTHVLVADETGQALGFGRGGPGNHEVVGYDGLRRALSAAAGQALAAAGLTADRIAGAGFGVAGFDWPSEKEPTLEAVATLGLTAPTAAVNDTLIGLLAGSEEGWGIAVVSGTGCNCWGWDRARQRLGQVTGGGAAMGEAAGATEVVAQAVRAVAHAWTRRGPDTRLSQVFIDHTGSRDLPDLLHRLTAGQVSLTARAAPLVFEAAAAGDAVAVDIIQWAGRELGELARAVIRQLDFADLEFDVVTVGSLFKSSILLTDTLQAAVRAAAPHARFVGLGAPPVVGAVILGMEQAGLALTPARRDTLARSTVELQAAAFQPAV